ncbi:MAG: hypothetical protein AAFY57_13740 [Cyanobacteria bacterium J06642_2]
MLFAVPLRADGAQSQIPIYPRSRSLPVPVDLTSIAERICNSQPVSYPPDEVDGYVKISQTIRI